MSGTQFYLEHGYSPSTKTTLIHGTDTISVWTPITNNRIIVTDACISTNYAGTIAFYFDNTTGQKIAEYLLAASATISPVIGAWESTTVSGRIFAKVQTSGTDGWRVNLTGFEIPSA